MFKKVFIFILLLIITTFNQVLAQTETPEATASHLILFEQPGCPDCAKQKEFFNQLLDNYPDITIESHNILDKNSVALLKELATTHQIADYRLMVPTVFINGHLFQGYSNQNNRQISDLIQGLQLTSTSNLINIPFLGETNLSNWSLPLTTTIIGSLDGLNVCSIGAIVLILMLVVTLDSRKKTIFYGSLFIFTSAFIYGILVFIWTTAISALIGHLALLKIMIGLASFGGGIFFIYKFYQFLKYGPSCNSGGGKLVANATKKMQTAFNSQQGIIIIASSVIIFAAIITLVELPCSIALPVIYAGILAESQLSLMAYLGYILLYLFFYMLIEIVIFIIAVITKEVYFAQSKALAWIYLAGALVLLFLGGHYLLPTIQAFFP